MHTISRRKKGEKKEKTFHRSQRKTEEEEKIMQDK